MMPQNRYNHRYSDFISEVMHVIIENQRQETSIVSGIIDQIAHLKPHNRNIETVLRLLSDRLRCSLLLTDRGGTICTFAPWPFGAEWRENDLNSIADLRLKNSNFNNPTAMHINGTDVLVYCITLDIAKQKSCFLAGIDEGNTLNTSYLSQIEELLLLISTIWKNTFAAEDTDVLLDAIINNHPREMQRIAQAMQIDITSFDTVWILCENQKNDAETEHNPNWLAVKLTAFLKGNKKTVLVDVLKDYVVAFINSNSNPFVEFPQEFIKEVQSPGQNDLVLFSSAWHAHESTEEVRQAFSLMEENIKHARILYPHQNIFTRHELQFIQTCRNIVEGSEAEFKNATKILTPLLQDEAGKDVLDTLTVFLLDCQSSIPDTAEKLFIHKNTVKYRIKKSERLLGINLLKMPEVMTLYTALAMMRILS